MFCSLKIAEPSRMYAEAQVVYTITRA